eukprot:4832429-Pyramimonas_sp.AAC.1
MHPLLSKLTSGLWSAYMGYQKDGAVQPFQEDSWMSCFLQCFWDLWNANAGKAFNFANEFNNAIKHASCPLNKLGESSESVSAVCAAFGSRDALDYMSSVRPLYVLTMLKELVVIGDQFQDVVTSGRTGAGP